MLGGTFRSVPCPQSQVLGASLLPVLTRNLPGRCKHPLGHNRPMRITKLTEKLEPSIDLKHKCCPGPGQASQVTEGVAGQGRDAHSHTSSASDGFRTVAGATQSHPHQVASRPHSPSSSPAPVLLPDEPSSDPNPNLLRIHPVWLSVNRALEKTAAMFTSRSLSLQRSTEGSSAAFSSLPWLPSSCSICQGDLDQLSRRHSPIMKLE